MVARNAPKLSVILPCDPRCARLVEASSAFIETMIDRRINSSSSSDSSNKGAMRTIGTHQKEEINNNIFLKQQLPLLQ